MRPGETANFECPHSLDEEANPDMMNMFGNAYIATQSPMKYEMEIMNCDIKPPSQADLAQMEKLLPNKCFYIVNGVDNLALEVNKEDRYAPRITGVYDL